MASPENEENFDIAPLADSFEEFLQNLQSEDEIEEN
jgi:hypothetical protein